MPDQRCGTCGWWKEWEGFTRHSGNCEFRPPGPLPEWMLDSDNYRSAFWGRNCKAWKEKPDA